MPDSTDLLTVAEENKRHQRRVTGESISAAYKEDKIPEGEVKIILVGDSAVGKSKLVERFLLDEYKPQQLSTYALTLFQFPCKLTDPPTLVDFWDTAGQERFNTLHPSYYYQAHACILCFDLTRKITYKNLENWYAEIQKYRPSIPILLIGNKVDLDPESTQRDYKFSKKEGIKRMHFVSASDGTNVVAAFEDVIREALNFKKQRKEGEGDFMDQVMSMLEETNARKTENKDDSWD